MLPFEAGGSLLGWFLGRMGLWDKGNEALVPWGSLLTMEIVSTGSSFDSGAMDIHKEILR
jgi:hypothetical protein